MNPKSRVSRRDLISGAIGGAAALTLYHTLPKGKKNDGSKRDQNLSSEGKLFAVPKDKHILTPRTTVGIARCHTAAHTKDMTFDEIKDTVRKAVNRAGGLKGIIKNGDRVILKPNLMTLYINWNRVPKITDNSTFLAVVHYG